MTLAEARVGANEALARFREDIFPPAAPHPYDFSKVGARLREAVLTGRFAHTLQALADDPACRYHIAPILTAPLLTGPHHSVAIFYVAPGNALAAAHTGMLLRDHAQDGVVVNASASTVRIRHYVQPAPEPHDVLDPAKTLDDHGLRTYEKGDFAVMTGGETVLDFVDVDAPTVFIAAFGTAARYTASWGYDPVTLAPAKLFQSTLQDTRLRYALELVHAFADWWAAGEPCLADIVEPLTRHGSHALRWSALRALDAVDEPRATAALASALSDPHPHVAAAARQALA